MDAIFYKELQKLTDEYRTKCADDAKVLESAVKNGDAASIYSTLYENANLPSIPKNDKLLHSARFFYFIGYCLKYNNGIPLIEILCHWIDSNERSKVIDAAKSQVTLFEFLLEQGVDIKILADYIYEKEIIEYAVDEEKKSTGVLKRIVEKKKLSTNLLPSEIENAKKEILKCVSELNISKKPEGSNASQKHKGFNSKEWCTILYFSDYTNKKDEEDDKDIVITFHTKEKLPFAEISFLQNFRVVKGYIENNQKQAIGLMTKVLPYFDKAKNTRQDIEKEIETLNNDMEKRY